ncbi:YqiC protein [Escherichia coli]|uniref:YqiC protein n=1 Tax=Escherichia coli TaxID=562 RepID=A0A3S4NP30_ECOLX|nr:YqiC protein [Escherichia coli]
MWRKNPPNPTSAADASRSGEPRRIRRTDASPVRTREKLALLEQRISELEARNNSVADLQSPPAIPPIDKAE